MSEISDGDCTGDVYRVIKDLIFKQERMPSLYFFKEITLGHKKVINKKMSLMNVKSHKREYKNMFFIQVAKFRLTREASKHKETNEIYALPVAIEYTDFPK